MDRFRKAFADKRDIVRIPEVVDELTGPRVLCIEYLDGVKIRQARARGLDMKRIGERYLEVAYTMLFEHGAFHGDLHPGNVLVLDGEVLGLLDFGMVGALSRDMRDALVSMITVQGDTEFASVEQQRHLLATAPTDYDRYAAARIMAT